jgi:hypothetical protein
VIDGRFQGLRCRADPVCRVVFHVAGSELTTGAAARRDAHELGDHAYTHVVSPAAFPMRFADYIAAHARAGNRRKQGV